MPLHRVYVDPRTYEHLSTLQGDNEMKLARALPKLGALAELLTYQCPQCGEVLTVEGESSHARTRSLDAA